MLRTIPPWGIHEAPDARSASLVVVRLWTVADAWSVPVLCSRAMTRAVVAITEMVRDRVRRDGVDLRASGDLADRYVRDAVRHYSERALGGAHPLLDDEQEATRSVLAAITGFGVYSVRFCASGVGRSASSRERIRSWNRVSPSRSMNSTLRESAVSALATVACSFLSFKARISTGAMS
ncbi:hypothetical protein C1N71_05195 [Agrococcus sp. SGAir0287]|nr:hypothetical protein C1N71_05195 [Agrococcus sp. SGAir0287]